MTDPARIEEVLDQTFDYSKSQSFLGYNKHDALNSPLVSTLLGWSKWTRVVAIQLVMRFPINLRPILFTRKTLNPKGLALFVSGLVDRYRTKGNEHYLDEAKQLILTLSGLKSSGVWSGDCWGYPYPWQDLNFFAPSGLPNAIVTVFVCEAHLDLYEVTGEASLLDTVKRATKFLTEDLPVLYSSDEELCLSYIPDERNRVRVMDVSILIGALLARLDKLSGSNAFNMLSFRLVNYVVKRQTKEGAWFYTDPPEHSPVRHDNYHTGFIIDALGRYIDVYGNKSLSDKRILGLEFYRNRLFNEDGSPRWMSDRDFPHDVHGAAQGLITFSQEIESNSVFLRRLLGWMLERLYSGKGKFYYQQHRLFTKKVSYMRWCNAWAFRALSKYALARKTQQQ